MGGAFAVLLYEKRFSHIKQNRSSPRVIGEGTGIRFVQDRERGMVLWRVEFGYDYTSEL